MDSHGPIHIALVALLLTSMAGVASASTTRLEGEAPLELPTQDEAWQVRLVAEHDGGDTKTATTSRLEVRRPDGTNALEASVPTWATPPDFTLDAEAVAYEDATILLVQIRPSSVHDGPEKITLQLAWRLVHGRLNRTAFAETSLITRNQFSELEGGSMLEFRDTDAAEATPPVLVRHSASGTSNFCTAGDGPLRVYEAYDAGEDTFERVVAIDDLVASAPSLEAFLPDTPFQGPYTQGVFQWYWASGEYREQGNQNGASLAVRPVVMGDGQFDTGWTADASRDLRGTYATASISAALPVTGLRIVPGVAKPASEWTRHGRPKTLLVTVEDGSSFVVDIPEVERESLVEKRGVVVDLPKTIETTCMTVVHLGAYTGGTGGRVSLAEVTPLTPVDARSPEETARRLVERIAQEEDGRDRRRLSYIGAGLGAALAQAIEDALEEMSGPQRRRIVPLVRHLPATRAVDILTEFFRSMDRDAVEFREIKRGLVAQRDAAATPLAEMLDDYTVNDPKYVDIVRLLGRIGGPDELRTLVDELGKGASTARGVRVRAVASGGPSLLESLFARLSIEEAGPATIDALRAIHLIGKRVTVGTVELPENAGRLLQLLRKAEDRRVLLAALQATHYLSMPGVVEVIDTRLATHDGVLIRKASMDALQYRSGAEARQILEEALTDDSPDVRIAAVTAIGEREDNAESMDALFEYTERETWRPGLKQAYAVLADISRPETERFFIKPMTRSDGHRKAEMAATALVRADRTIGDDMAIDLVEREKANPAVRRKGVDMLGLGDTEAGHEYLMNLATTESGELRDRALLSLGRRQSDVARMRLMQIAREGDDLDARQHAIRALAFYHSQELVAALKEWKSDAPPELRSTIRQTVKIIENRGAIEDVSRELDSLINEQESR
jgi:HEAT repeat protein